jgi:hypothetical protein
MIHAQHLTTVQVTIHLKRLFGGFWAHKTFSLQYGDETLTAKTDNIGNSVLRIVNSPDKWTALADGRVLGTFKTKPEDFTVEFEL